MKRSTILLVALVTAMSVTSTTVFARDAAEVELVRRAVAEATTAAGGEVDAERTVRAATLLERYVDVAAFEGRVFADVAPTLTPAQRKLLSDAFRPLLVHRIALRLHDLPPLKPRIEAPREDGGETHVRLFYKPEAADAEDVEVDLTFAKRPAGSAGPPRVIDATIGGTNLSKNLRASINKVMRKEGFDALVARLKQLRESRAPGPHKSSDLTL